MLDHNNFKKQIKEWINSHPQGSIEELVDYCEELIPPNQYSSYSWLIEQTTQWYKHILAQRKALEDQIDTLDEE